MPHLPNHSYKVHDVPKGRLCIYIALLLSLRRLPGILCAGARRALSGRVGAGGGDLLDQVQHALTACIGL